MDKTKLGYLGEDFQYRLVNAFIVDGSFFKSLHSIIDQNVFTEKGLRSVVAVMKEYTAEYGTVPSYGMIDIALKKSHVLNPEDRQYYEEVLGKIRKTTTEGIEEVKKLAGAFFKQQNLIAVANHMLKIAGDGDLERYSECEGMLSAALRVGNKKHEVSTPFESPEADVSKLNEVIIPTGVKSLDEVLGGGLSKGKLGIIIGAMGFGKTSMTTYLGAMAAKHRCEQNYNEGFKVLQIVFEDLHRDIHRKYISHLTGIETRTLGEDPDNVMRILNERHELRDIMNNNVHIIKLESGAYTASDIKEVILEEINNGFKPDLVIVDYFGCLAPEKGFGNKDITERESATMRKFENMASELDIAIWMPVQGNRESISAELVTNDKIGGSIAKNQIAMVVLSITRSVEDIRQNRAVISVLKNRSGGAGEVIDVTFNNGLCWITDEKVLDFQDALAYNDHIKEVEQVQMDRMEEELKNTIRSTSGTYNMALSYDPNAKFGQ